MAAIAKRRPDAIILDLCLPDRDGFTVIQEVRKAALTPIVVLSARSDVKSKVKALELGANDYVTKPFHMAELLARLKGALRHGLQAAGEAPSFRTGPLAVDLLDRKILLQGVEIRLSPKEFGLLRLLIIGAGKVVSHRQLLKEMGRSAAIEDVQYLRNIMFTLREKLEPSPDIQQLLVNEPRVGYRLLVVPTE
jgi:two-component system KDP operon response regulator KdpE